LQQLESFQEILLQNVDGAVGNARLRTQIWFSVCCLCSTVSFCLYARSE
jgi:hypothetical protein